MGREGGREEGRKGGMEEWENSNLSRYALSLSSLTAPIGFDKSLKWEGSDKLIEGDSYSDKTQGNTGYCAKSLYVPN
jgi:hypothetical protein